MHNCPRCNTPLTATDSEGAAFETCGHCHGKWVGRDELRRLIELRERPWDGSTLEGLAHAPAARVPLAGVAEHLPCPACGREMETFNYAGDSGVILDKCADCGGVWLDGGELEKVRLVVEASEEGLDQDAKRFSGRLHEVEVQEDLLEQKDNRATHEPLLAAFFNRLLGVD